MVKRISYKEYIISSAPLPLQGGDFSSNGTVEHHDGAGVTVKILNDLQAIRFSTEEDAHNFYIKGVKEIIDGKSN